MYLVAQSCLTLCNPIDCSCQAPLSMGILQATILEWVAMPFSRVSFQPSDWTQVFYITGRFFTIWTICVYIHVFLFYKTVSILPYMCIYICLSILQDMFQFKKSPIIYWALTGLCAPNGSVVKNPSANAGGAGVIPGLRWSPGEGNGSLLGYICLENSMDRKAWWATAHEVTKSWRGLSD